MKKNNKKGFTLAELLIVIAIIAVLVAIAVPVFNGAMAKAEHAADVANVRAAYAELVVDKMLAADFNGTVTITDADFDDVADKSTVVVDETAGTITITHSKNSALQTVITMDLGENKNA